MQHRAGDSNTTHARCPCPSTAEEEVDRLQLSLSAAQHNIASLRTAASDHSALLSALHEQLAEKAGRVLQLEECQQDQERQLAALHNRVKVGCTLCPVPASPPPPPHISHDCSLLSASSASTASWLCAWGRWRLKGRPSASPCGRARRSAVPLTRRLESRQGRLPCCVSNSQPQRYSLPSNSTALADPAAGTQTSKPHDQSSVSA